MWINRNDYLLLVAHEAAERALNASAREQNKVLQVNLDWARVRVSQLDKERAQLMYQLMGIKVPVPEIEQVRVDLPGELQHPLNQMPSFDDPGDDEAKKLGYK